MCTSPPSAKAASLHIEMRVKIGRGYVSADKNFDEDLGHRVHSDRLRAFAGAQGQLLVEAARLGQMTDYDKLTVGRLDQRSDHADDAVGLARQAA